MIGWEVLFLSEMVTAAGGGLALLDTLAEEARYWAAMDRRSPFELGRILTQVKPMIGHGKWLEWIADNAGCSERTAQAYMKVYDRFSKRPEAAGITDRSKLIKLLPMREEYLDEFLRENDVNQMSARQIGEAVKAANRAEPENRKTPEPASAPEKKPVSEREDANGRELAKKYIAENRKLENKIEELKGRLAQKESEAGDMKATNSLLNKRLNEMAKEQAERQGREARQEADTEGAVLTAKGFAEAAQRFIGACAQMPQMRRAFSRMEGAEWDAFDRNLTAIEAWCKAAREAMNAVEAE